MQEPRMQESIYALVQPAPQPVVKGPMYRSKTPGNLAPTGSTFAMKGTSMSQVNNLAGDPSVLPKEPPVPLHKFKQDHATWGKPTGSYVSQPDKFLVQGAGSAKVKTLKTVRKEEPELLKPKNLMGRIKPPVPRKEEAPVMNLVSGKNYVVANAVDAILAVPKKDSVGGTDYLRKGDYGKTPEYLSKIQQDIAAEYEYIDQMRQQQEDDEPVRSMTNEERQKLIDGLKSKWEEVNRQYQAATHITKIDTFGKKARKEKYEAQLSQIEKDIEMLAKNGGVFVDLAR